MLKNLRPTILVLQSRAGMAQFPFLPFLESRGSVRIVSTWQTSSLFLVRQLDHFYRRTRLDGCLLQKSGCRCRCTRRMSIDSLVWEGVKCGLSGTKANLSMWSAQNSTGNRWDIWLRVPQLLPRHICLQQDWQRSWTTCTKDLTGMTCHYRCNRPTLHFGTCPFISSKDLSSQHNRVDVVSVTFDISKYFRSFAVVSGCSAGFGLSTSRAICAHTFRRTERPDFREIRMARIKFTSGSSFVTYLCTV